MKPGGTLLLTRKDVAALLTIEESIAAVEHAFKLYGEGKTSPPGFWAYMLEMEDFTSRLAYSNSIARTLRLRSMRTSPRMSCDLGYP